MPRPPPSGSLIIGLAIGLAGNIFTCGFLGLVSNLAKLHDAAAWLMMAPGLTQFAWALPIGAVFGFLRRKYTVLGLALMLLAVGLVNAVGWGLVRAGIGMPAPTEIPSTP